MLNYDAGFVFDPQLNFVASDFDIGQGPGGGAAIAPIKAPPPVPGPLQMWISGYSPILPPCPVRLSPSTTGRESIVSPSSQPDRRRNVSRSNPGKSFKLPLTASHTCE